jgi:hypothetical protein
VAAGGGRLRNRIVTALLFAGGAAFVGAATHGLWGSLGAMIPFSLAVAIAFSLALASLVWYVRRSAIFPFSRQGAQANREWARSRPFGPLYFGGVMGIGLLTAISTPLVYVGVATSIALGSFWGLLYGGGFGIGRAVPAFVGSLVGGRLSPTKVANDISIEFQSRARSAGLLIILPIAASLIIALLD